MIALYRPSRVIQGMDKESWEGLLVVADLHRPSHAMNTNHGVSI